MISKIWNYEKPFPPMYKYIIGIFYLSWKEEKQIGNFFLSENK